MTAQLANGGFKIKPKIIYDKNSDTYEQIKSEMEKNRIELLSDFQQDDALVDFSLEKKKRDTDLYKPLYRNQENVKFVLEAMFASTNEVRGTSYSSRKVIKNINLQEKLVPPKSKKLLRFKENLI